MILRKTLVIASLSLIGFTSNAQSTHTPSKDVFDFNFHYDGLAGETDGIKLKGLNRGMSTHITLDFPLKASNFSFAAGLGFSTHNYYLDDQRFIIDGLPNVNFEDLFAPDVTNYKKMKLSVNYLEAPVEFRFFTNKSNRNVGFKASIGMKVGYLVDAHTKEKVSVNDRVITQKFGSAKYLFNQWRFAPTVKIGWGNFYVFGQYNATQLFSPGTGPEVFPYSIGIGISGL